jgi:hypothetical protein
MLTRIFGIFKCCSPAKETPRPVQTIAIDDIEAQTNWNGGRYKMVILPPAPPLERVQSTSSSPKSRG